MTRMESGCTFLEVFLVGGFLVAAVLIVLFARMVLASRWSDAVVIGMICALGTGLIIVPVLWGSRRKTPERFTCMACHSTWERHPE